MAVAIKPRKQIKTVKISDLKRNFFARRSLNDDHVLVLADLIAAGHELPPPIVEAVSLEVVDGRHRIAAYEELLDKTEIAVELVSFASKADMLAMALTANLGGSLPPSKEDIVHALIGLAEVGISRKQAVQMLEAVLPKDVVARYYDNARSAINKRKLKSAVDAVVDDGATVQQAAKTWGIELDTLKAALKKTRVRSKDQISDITMVLTRVYKSHGNKLAQHVRYTFLKFENGDVDERYVEAVLKHIDQSIARSTRNLRDWRNRFTELKRAGTATLIESEED